MRYAIRHMTVSYTHLDVYKRQVRKGAERNRGGLFKRDLRGTGRDRLPRERVFRVFGHGTTAAGVFDGKLRRADRACGRVRLRGRQNFYGQGDYFAQYPYSARSARLRGYRLRPMPAKRLAKYSADLRAGAGQDDHSARSFQACLLYTSRCV